MGIRALSIESGLTNENLTEVSTDRTILHTAPEVILVADHTKIGKVSTALVAPLTAIHTLVTDRGAPPEFVDRVKDLGISVIIC
jgi:DeoR/GlpR family transcriptional regulator of sugar metabolism